MVDDGYVWAQSGQHGYGAHGGAANPILPSRIAKLGTYRPVSTLLPEQIATYNAARDFAR